MMFTNEKSKIFLLFRVSIIKFFSVTNNFFLSNNIFSVTNYILSITNNILSITSNILSIINNIFSVPNNTSFTFTAASSSPAFTGEMEAGEQLVVGDVVPEGLHVPRLLIPVHAAAAAGEHVPQNSAALVVVAHQKELLGEPQAEHVAPPTRLHRRLVEGDRLEQGEQLEQRE
jgi:hypothetical protein